MFIFKYLDKVHDSRQEWLLQTDRLPKTAVALSSKTDAKPIHQPNEKNSKITK
jgi:hypothetical protein